MGGVVESMSVGKTIVLGVTGSIAAWKVCEIVMELVRLGFNVYVIMTRAATKLITPLTMSTLSRNPVFTDMFKGLQHTNLASLTDILLIAPATANIIGKMANGIADDLLTTTALACRAPKLIAPAMNPNMYANAVVKANILKLKEIGVEFIEPEYGRSVCGDLGVGLLAPTGKIVSKVIEVLEKTGEERRNLSGAQKAIV
jgi:phosphopantothenoylcysteine decarboxylase/phosphopantothenate--cysteine ligase